MYSVNCVAFPPIIIVHYADNFIHSFCYLQQYFGIRTAGLEEKATACQMLVCYAKELKVAFAEYSEEVVKIMVPLLKFYFHDGILECDIVALNYVNSGLLDQFFLRK